MILARCLVALSLLSAAGPACTSPDGDAGSEVDADVNPACVVGHDPASPQLRLNGIVPYLPLALAERDVTEQLQLFVDVDGVVFLLALRGLGEDDGTGEAGSGEAVGDGSYRFAPEGSRDLLALTASGRDFASDPAGIEGSFDLSNDFVSARVPLRRLVYSGTFETDERCSVGTRLTETPPTSWQTQGRILGMITVADARQTEVSFGIETANLCDWLAGDAPYHACGGPVEAWPYPPDVALDGEPAWTFDVRFAATAVSLVP